MAWNFGDTAGAVHFTPITSAAVQEFNGMTVDFKGLGTICSIYASADPFTALHPTPGIKVLATGTPTPTHKVYYEHYHWGGAPGGTIKSEWGVDLDEAAWHHLNIYTDSVGRSPVCLVDGVDLGLGTVIANPIGFGSNQGGPWVIGGYRLGTTYFPDFSGRMAHFSWWGASSDVGFAGVTRFREMLQVYRFSPLYVRDFIGSSNGDPGQIVYVPMADEVSEEICRVTGVALEKHGSVTREDDAQGWWVIGRMDPYTDWAVAVPPVTPPVPPVPTPLNVRIVAEFIL